MAWVNDNLRRRRNPGYNQVELRVDPLEQLDDKIHGLLENARRFNQLRQVLLHTNVETRYRNVLNRLEETMARDQAELKTTIGELNRILAQLGISPLYLAIAFALLCFFLVYLYIKLFR